MPEFSYLTYQGLWRAQVKVQFGGFPPLTAHGPLMTGRGRGRQVVASMILRLTIVISIKPPFPAAKTADLILIMLDATKSEEHRRLLEIALDAVGIRLNKTKPDIIFKKKTTGGVRILLQTPLGSFVPVSSEVVMPHR